MGVIKLEDLRSHFDFGVASETRKGIMLGMGYTEEELQRPLIAVVNSWNEYNPGHVHLKELAERVKQGVREQGGLPIEVMTTAICDGMVLKDPKYIEVPSRNSIADQVELTVEGQFFDGMVMLSTCDSIVPGHLMGAARIDIPTIMVTGGYMPHTMHKGKDINYTTMNNSIGKAESGAMPMDEFNDLVRDSFGICGACDVMTTGNSMCMVAEAMGISMPGNATMSAVGPRIRRIAYEAGKQIMYLVEHNITARQIITPESIKNAIKMTMAMAGSGNLILHIPAIGSEAGYDEPWWKYFDEAGQEVPLLCNAAPSGPHTVTDIEMAGGIGAIMKNCMPKLNGDCLSVTGKPIREVYKDYEVYDPEVIRTLDNPVSTEPGQGVLYGSLAPEGCFVKIAAVPENLMTFRGPAVVFDTLQDAIAGLRSGKVQPGSAAILRFLGLKGRFGTTAYPFQLELKGHTELFNSCAVITDGRFSGASSGLSIGYVAPEAALAGPLAIVQDGDMISIDIHGRKIDLEITQDEFEKRMKDFHWERPKGQNLRYLDMFGKTIGSAAKGSIWDV